MKLWESEILEASTGPPFLIFRCCRLARCPKKRRPLVRPAKGSLIFRFHSCVKLLLQRTAILLHIFGGVSSLSCPLAKGCCDNSELTVRPAVVHLFTHTPPILNRMLVLFWLASQGLLPLGASALSSCNRHLPYLHLCRLASKNILVVRALFVFQSVASIHTRRCLYFNVQLLCAQGSSGLIFWRQCTLVHGRCRQGFSRS